MELDKKAHYISDTQQREKGDNAFEASPVKFKNIRGVVKAN